MQDKEQEIVLHELPKGLIGWYPFQAGSRALFIEGKNEECNCLSEVLAEQDLQLQIMKIEELLSADVQEEYDYIVMAGVLEQCIRPCRVLEKIHSLLSKYGKLLIGADNRLGIRYFCGDRDKFTKRNFDSIENYTRVRLSEAQEMAGHAYDKAEWKYMLEQAGFFRYKFYSVFPNITRPQILFADNFSPKEELEVRIFPEYNSPDTIFLEEEQLYTSLIHNGLFHTLANGFLIECSLDDKFSDASQITMSMDRGKSHALCTIIRECGIVEKRAVYREGIERLKVLTDNTERLQSRGIPMIRSQMQGNVLHMPYVEGEAAIHYFRRLLHENQEKFMAELERFWQYILQSSEHMPYEQVDWDRFDPYWDKQKQDDPNRNRWRKLAFASDEDRENIGVILQDGYIDLVALNCMHTDEGFVFYDQEFIVPNLPAAVILLRTIDFIYRNNVKEELVLPRKTLLEKYHLVEQEKLFHRFMGRFLKELRHEEELSDYHKTKRPDRGIINSNRQRMNYSEKEYQRIFVDIFRGVEGRKIYLFGSGNYAADFLSQFGGDCDIAGIVDNDAGKWSMFLKEIPIMSPEHLCSLEKGTYKVIVCIKNFIFVIRQLQSMGITDFSVYDSSLEYPRRRRIVPATDSKDMVSKKYHVGYIAGVFDLFHIGHLNLLRRAKEQCNYLIVGIVTDEGVISKKKTNPVVPFTERMEIVRACRYVDEVVEIPLERDTTEEAYRRYQFDVQFSGSDYEKSPAWIAKKAFLESKGSAMVFFPYTEGTSTTKIKEELSNRRSKRGDNKL